MKNIKIFVNLCGLLFGKPKNLSLKNYLILIKEALRKISNVGCQGVLVWLPWPLIENPLKMDPIKRNLFVVKHNNKNWVLKKEDNYVINDIFINELWLPFVKLCIQYNLEITVGMTGYTNKQKLFKTNKTFSKNSLYGEDGLIYVKFLMETIERVSNYKKIKYEFANEPEASMLGKTYDEGVEINVNLTRWFQKLVNYAKELGIEEERLQINCTEGFNRETGKRFFTHIGGTVTQSLRGKHQFLPDNKTIKEIFAKKFPYKNTYVYISDHGATSLNELIGRVEQMNKNQEFTSINRKYVNCLAVSMDGSKMKNDEGMFGQTLLNFTKELFEYFIKIGKKLIFYCHPRNIYTLIGGKNSPHLHEIHLENLNMKYIEPSIKSYKNIYKEYPENKGKFPKEEEKEEDVIDVIIEEEDTVVVKEEEKINKKKRFWIFCLIFLIVIFLIFIGISC